MARVVPNEIIEQRFNEMIKLWQKYIVLFDKAVKTEKYTKEQQDEFCNLQLEITRRAQFLRLSIPDNLFDVWKNMRGLFLETPTIDILKKEAEFKIDSLKHVWHDVSISLNQKQGHLKAILQEEEEEKEKGFFGRKK